MPTVFEWIGNLGIFAWVPFWLIAALVISFLVMIGKMDMREALSAVGVSALIAILAYVVIRIVGSGPGNVVVEAFIKLAEQIASNLEPPIDLIE